MTPGSTSHDTVIIGGGISGLTAAWWLYRKGIDVVVLEKNSSPGGTMQTAFEDGWLIETGPNSALETTPLFARVFGELGIESEVLYANPEANNRYILRGGTLHSLPMSPVAFLKTDLFSLRGKLRLFKEPFIGRATDEETIAEFVERRLGREFLDYAINPFVAGVFAGNPEQLSVRSAFPKLYALEEKYGGLIKGLIGGRKERKRRAEKAKDRARMFSFARGMETLPSVIAHKLGDRCIPGSLVRRLSADNAAISHRFTIEYQTESGKTEQMKSRAVILAVPSAPAAELLREFSTETAQLLHTIYYPPVAEIFLGYRKEDIPRKLDGFGFLVPAKENRRILGTIWTSAIFPGRAPNGYEALTTFVGGSRQPGILDVDDSTLLGIVREELRSIMGIDAAPAFVRIHQWKHAIPQYNLGYQNVLNAIDVLERNEPGIFVCSNYRGGISVSDCMINADRITERVVSFFTPVTG